MTAGRPKARLNEIVDGVITTLFESSGAAAPHDIYNILRDDHDEAVRAEVEEDAKRGLMRRIEGRLKHFKDIGETDDRQMLLPGVPADLQRRMGRVITVDRDDGTCSYHDLMHPNTTVGHVRSHVAILRKQRNALDKKIEAFIEALERCGFSARDTEPFVSALRSAAALAPAD